MNSGRPLGNQPCRVPLYHLLPVMPVLKQPSSLTHNPCISHLPHVCAVLHAPIYSPQHLTTQLPPQTTTKEPANTTPISVMECHSPLEILSLASVVHNGKTFSVLWISPSPSLPYTAFDMILPEPVAFCDPMSMTVNHYPTFTSQKCNWTSIFALVE